MMKSDHFAKNESLNSMESAEGLTGQLSSILADVSHPIQGTFYLFLLAVVFRWRWPKHWNNLLKNISAPIEKNSNKDNKS